MQMRIILKHNSMLPPHVESTSVKRLRVSLGTLVAIEATAPSESIASAALESAFAAVAEVDRRMHPKAAHSDVARINDSPVNTAVPVHASVVELLRLARRLNVLTAGIFDPCLPEQPGSLRDVEAELNSVTCRAPVALDFGGFAKGYAVDVAVEALKMAGCTAGVVNAGGDLRVFGPKANPVFLRGPGSGLTQIDLDEAALAVSDADSQRRPPEHRGYYCRCVAAQPNRGSDRMDGGHPLVTRYAAVTAREASVADALAKCVMLCPKEISDRALRAFGATRLAAQ